MNKMLKGLAKLVSRVVAIICSIETVNAPWIRFCIGMAILFLAVTPLVIAIRWW